MQKISTVLLKTRRHKITGNYKQVDEKGHTLGYCSLGVLACNKKMFRGRKSTAPLSGPWGILKAYKLKDEQVAEKRICPLCDVNTDLIDLIIHMNDDHPEMTFKEVGKALKEWGL